MRTNKTKEKIRSGGQVIGCFCNIPSPEVVELAGAVGFDFALIDCEHGAVSFDSARDMIRAAENVDITPIVRTPQNVPQVILRYLDYGAMGIQVPQGITREDAETAVRSVKYHPKGNRGLAAARAADYGLRGTISEYVQRANDETMVIFHIESLKAVENLSGILQVPDIDVFFVGPSDLSQSAGYPGQTSHPEVQSIVTRTISEIINAGRSAGTVAHNREALVRMTDLGVQYLACGATFLFAAGAKVMFGT